MLKFYSFLLICLLSFFGFSSYSMAQFQGEVEYSNDLILDSDLDGLTNEGEKQLFGTDELNPDSDADGFLDGAEVISGVDPLDKLNQAQNTPEESPWAWYSVRAAGLIGFSLLYLGIFFGLFIRIPFIRNLFGPIQTLNFHRWLSLQATVFIFFHAFLMIFDSFYSFSLLDSFIPFHSSFNPLWLSLGIIGFYLMVILVVSSYLRNRISNKAWRVIHYLSIILYLGVAAHAFLLGTDLKLEWVRIVFYSLNFLLVILVLTNIFLRIRARKHLIKEAVIS